MAAIAFPCARRSLCIDGPLANLSSEDEDFFRFPGEMLSYLPPPLDENWQTDGCLQTCYSTVSQEDADLCALRQAILCVYPHLNEQQTCTSNCPDGLPFSYIVPAGVFAGTTVEEANQVAYAYACQQSLARRICISSLGECAICVNEIARIGVLAENVPVGSTWSVIGSLPPGMSLSSSNPGDALLHGVPTAAGNYTFTLRVTTSFGDIMDKQFTLGVIGIQTTTLTPYHTGVPYSFQLQATGGSGTYGWRLVAGTLPDGLVLDLDGLIHGTPTNTTTNLLTFQCVDTGCVTPGKEFFQPRVSLTAQSRTTIATILGFPEYVGPRCYPISAAEEVQELGVVGPQRAMGHDLGRVALRTRPLRLERQHRDRHSRQLPHEVREELQCRLPESRRFAAVIQQRLAKLRSGRGRKSWRSGYSQRVQGLLLGGGPGQLPDLQ